MEKDIKKIILEHLSNQNSLIDDEGGSRLKTLVGRLDYLFEAAFAERTENTIEELLRRMPEDYEGNLGLNESYRTALGDFHEMTVPKEHRRLID